jgi:hypothetical protein
MTRVASFILFIRSILFILSEPFLSVADPLCCSPQFMYHHPLNPRRPKPMRRIAATLCALALCSAAWAQLTPPQTEALRAIAKGESPDWPAPDLKQTRALRAKAEAYLANLQQHHLPNGLAVDILWEDDARTAVAAYEGVDASTRRLGYYLAALVLKYAAAPDDETRAGIIKTFNAFDLLTTISGREGYLVRCVGPAKDELYRAVYATYPRGADPRRRGLGTRAYEAAPPRDNLVWLGDTSPEIYDGAALGLAATLKYATDPELQMRARSAVRRIAKRLDQDQWNIKDDQGHKTLTSIAWRLAWMRLAMTTAPAEYQHLDREYESLYAKMMEGKAGYRPPSRAAADYDSSLLDLDRLFVLCALETDLERRNGYRDLLESYYRQAADHLNAHLAAVYLLLGPNTGDPRARATLDGMLLDFPDPPNRLRLVNAPNPEAHGMQDARFAKEALLTHERPPADYLWAQAPSLAVGGADQNLEFPGLDYLLPYWMSQLAPKKS